MKAKLENLSSNDKLKILSFLSLLKRAPSKIMKWNDELELIYKGKRIKNSNILTLVRHALKKYSKSKPVGIRKFYKSLSHMSIPKNFLMNKKGKEIIKKMKENENTSKWRPPGKLNKN